MTEQLPTSKEYPRQFARGMARLLDGDPPKSSAQTITEQVAEFHNAFSFPVLDVPTEPDPETARLRLRLVAEEFCELLEAHGVKIEDIERRLRVEITAAPLDEIDLVGAADAMGDIDYVIEGTRLSYGIPRQEVADEIQRSNMAKVGGEIVNGKQMKPAGWKPPDIEGVLRGAGWKG